MHSHQDDETVSYVRRGELAGVGDAGERLSVRPGCVGIMSAGRGKSHEEWVPEDGEPVRMYHIAIQPRAAGLEPRYMAREPAGDPQAGLRLIVSGDGRAGSLPIHQDVDIYDGALAEGRRFEHRLLPGRAVWLTVAGGSVRLGEHLLREGDSARVVDEPAIDLTGEPDGDVLVFDLDPDAQGVAGTRTQGA